MKRAPVHEQYNCTGASMSWLCYRPTKHTWHKCGY